MSMQYHFNLTGNERKAFVNTASGILDKPAVYQKAPSFAYTIGSCTVDRNGVLSCPDGTSLEEVQKLLVQLKEQGYTPAPGHNLNGCDFVVEIPKTGFDEQALQNLEKIIASKSILLKKVLKTDSLEFILTEDTIRFPWFTLCGMDGEAVAYSQFVTALCRMAKEQKRVTAKERDNGNDKYTMRLFLVRLGLIGKEYKTLRRLLLSGLTGNGSWKSGHAPVHPAPATETADAASQPEPGNTPAEKEGGKSDGQ